MTALARAVSNDVSRYYGSIIPSVLNVFSMQGFLILNCIIGGQMLASVSSRLNDTLGIVIISVISLAVRSDLLHPFIRCAEPFVGDLLWLSVPSLVGFSTLPCEVG